MAAIGTVGTFVAARLARASRRASREEENHEVDAGLDLVLDIPECRSDMADLQPLPNLATRFRLGQ